MPSKEDQSSPYIERPSIYWLATEAQRAFLELSSFVPYRAIQSRNKSGDGHPVLVLPGFMASDFSTSPLRSFLKKIGYESYGWNLGRNYGNGEDLHALIEKVEDLFLSHRNPVSIIGWSLGGVFAREIAKRKPNLIRQIIMMGSPFGGVMTSNHASWVYRVLTNGRGTEDIDPYILKNMARPALVPTTAIYSKRDGIVPWKVCVENHVSDIHENIEVQGSHLGYGVNPQVLHIITDRLQYGTNNWKKFKK